MYQSDVQYVAMMHISRPPT